MNSYYIWIHIFRNLCNHSCPWLTILSTFGEALTLWLQKTLKEGWLKIINSPQELLCTPAPSDDALMSSIDESNNKESSTATLILFGPRLSRLCCWSEGTAALPHPSLSRRRRGKIPPIVVVLRSNNNASSRPPPPLVASSPAPLPTWGHSRRRRHCVLLHPPFALIKSLSPSHWYLHMELLWSYIKKVSTGMVDEKVTVISSFST